MKRILYSTVTKTIAVLLALLCVAFAMLTVTDGLVRFLEEEECIYEFEGDFTESRHMARLLAAPEHILYRVSYGANAWEDITQEETLTENHPHADDTSSEVTTSDESGTPETETQADTQPTPVGYTVPVFSENRTEIVINGESMTVEEYLEKSLSELYCADQIDYYIEWNGTVYTNCDAKDPLDLIKGDFYAFYKRDADGATEAYSSMDRYVASLPGEMVPTDTVTVSVHVRDSYAVACRTAWERQEALVLDTILRAVLFALGALTLTVYLICVCGKRADGSQRVIWLDYVWVELHLVFLFLWTVGAMALGMVVAEAYYDGYFPLKLLYPTAGAIAVLGYGGILASLLSVIRNLKAKRYVTASLILTLLRLVWKALVWVCKGIGRGCKAIHRALSTALSRKTAVILLVMLVIYTLFLGLGPIFAFWDEALLAVWVVFAILLFGFACFIAVHRACDLDSLRQGVREVRSGNLTHQVPTPKSEDMRRMAEDINDIAQGLDEAVAARLKAERLKAELITNVSHDLKTPLTSIISYTELLSKVEGLPEEAQDYARVIAQKSERLKNLTQDLFDISKVQSGNEEMIPEKLDVALLIEQAMGEHDREITASELSFVVDIPKGLYILADGRKMSRVVSNLIGNALKYAMKHTRVFLTARMQEREIVLECKNVAAYRMDFDGEEIVGRFVRGDESRSTEGSGLGLAIAKSYVELCGGRFEVVVDGDLFKVMIAFPAQE